MSNSQDTRIGRLFTPLEDSTLVILEFSGVESVNEINNFNVKVLCESGPVDANRLLGERVVVELDTRLGTTKYFHQIVFSVRHIANVGGGDIYELELRPWIWAMHRRVNSRIFTELSVTDIIEQLCNEYSGAYAVDVQVKLEMSLQALEYVVQYRESDLDFIRRLMEEYGINFHFKMTKYSHVMILTSAVSGFEPAQGADRVFSQDRMSLIHDVENFETWSVDKGVPSGSVRYLDYNFKTPSANMEMSAVSVHKFSGKTFEVLEYPGRYRDTNEGYNLVKRRANALEAGEESIRASGELISLGAGMQFNLSDHPDASQIGKYGVMSVHHMYSANQYRSGAGAGTESYHGTYQLVRYNSPVAPPQKTPRPVMRGPQTAVVVKGADGEIDEYGRIVVKFFWTDAGVSMPCRVSQMWAGPNWGSIFTPHVGMEVVVEFLDGDPDRPLIVGCVYNADNMPPWGLPTDRLKSGIKTVRDNRLMFDDKAGSELIEVNARKDIKVTVENDATRDVLHNSKDTIYGVSTETVEKNRTVTVKADEKKDITGNLTIEAGSSITLKCGGSTIEMKPGSITIKSMEVTVEGAGALNTSGGKATHKGVGVLIIQAPTVLIN